MSQEAIARIAPRQEPRISLRQSESILGYLMVAPLVVCILLLVVYPFFFAIAISFTDRVVGSDGQFVGFTNYVNLAQKPDFQASIRNTVVMVSAIQIIKLGIGLGLAALLNQKIRARQFWRGLILIPWAMPAFVAFITWKLLYAPQGGAFNYILINLGLVTTHVDS
ncbi:MAG: sugar ABC transporter permease [Anaerolineae bacterium]